MVVIILLEASVYRDIKRLQQTGHLRGNDFEEDVQASVRLRLLLNKVDVRSISVEQDEDWLAERRLGALCDVVDNSSQDSLIPHSSLVDVGDAAGVNFRNIFQIREKQMKRKNFAGPADDRRKSESLVGGRGFSQKNFLRAACDDRGVIFRLEVSRDLIEVDNAIRRDASSNNESLNLTDEVAGDSLKIFRKRSCCGVTSGNQIMSIFEAGAPAGTP